MDPLQESVSKPFYPDFWDDDEKMAVLFSPFRDNRQLNPHSWDSKMKFWTKMIMNEMEYSKAPVLEADTLPSKFSRNGKVPKCLQKVVAELFRNGELKQLSDFQSEINGGWISWGFGTFVKKPISWSLGAVLGTDNSQPEMQPYIHLDIVKRMAEEVLKHHYKLSSSDPLDQVMDLTTLSKQCKHICDPKYLKVVLLHLKKEQKVAMVELKNKETLVKFCLPEEKTIQAITDNDRKLLNLKDTEQELHNEIEQLYQEVEVCIKNAKDYLAKGLKASAKNALRKKKSLLTLIDKREVSLSNIQGLLQQIRGSKSNKKIFESYEAGVDILKAEESITTDKIDKTMVDLDELLEDQADLSAAIAQGPAGLREADIEDLEAELEDLIAEGGSGEPEKKTAPSKEKTFGLPDVPTFIPGPLSAEDEEELEKMMNSTFDINDKSTDAVLS